MNKLFPLPLYVFIKTVIRNGGITFNGLKKIPSWIVKLILFEPLRWIELRHNNKINKHEIKQDPIFVLGFYRSGTSFMHQFLTQDDRLGYHTNFQMIFPEIMLSSEWFLSPLFDFICRLFNFRDPVHRIQMSFKFPGEEDASMTTCLNPRGAQWGYVFPEIMMRQFKKYVMFEDIPNSEIENWKNDFVFLINKISIANKGKQIILKSPPNTARIKLLLSIFPRAKFIFVHRNPYDVYVSNQRFWEVTDRIYALGKTKDVDKNKIILETYSQIMNKYLDEKNIIPSGQLIEIAYNDLVNEPMDVMKKIYKKLALKDFNEIENKMQAYINKQKSYVRLKHELLADEKDMVAAMLNSFMHHWNYPLS